MMNKLDFATTFLLGVLCGCLLVYGALRYKRYQYYKQRQSHSVVIKKAKPVTPSEEQFVDFSITTPTTEK